MELYIRGPSPQSCSRNVYSLVVVTISQGGLNFSLFPKQPQEQCLSNLNHGDCETLSWGGRSSARAAAVKRASEAVELASGWVGSHKNWYWHGEPVAVLWDIKLQTSNANEVQSYHFRNTSICIDKMTQGSVRGWDCIVSLTSTHPNRCLPSPSARYKRPLNHGFKTSPCPVTPAHMVSLTKG